MQQLRIMGVTEEDSDETLVLADEEGQEYALPVDEALRTAVARRSTRPAHLTTRAEDARAPMTVREVQARLRAGATVEQMVAESGLDPARVERYAGPVQAERAYIAERARGTQISPPSSTEQHRIAFGDAPATLQAMVLVRLRALEVDLASLAWDAWRRQDGNWQILCWFDADDLSAGRARVDVDPPAEWVFTPESRHLRPVGPWAQTLSSLPPETGSRRGPRRLTAVDAPFDVESSTEQPSPRRRPDRAAGPVPADEQDTSPIDAAAPDPATARPAGPSVEGDEHEDLLDVLRARRGQRLGADEDADDKLALMLTRDEQTAGQDAPRLRALEDEDGEEPSLTEAERTDAWGFSYAETVEAQTTKPGGDAGPVSGATGTHDTDQPTTGEDSRGSSESRSPDEEGASEGRPRPKRSGARRPNMPRWDDILFGSKGD
ncbi:septation protein SepH [Nesterenkonia sp. HG001]|uniref:septation protein SepH n=1 Tax=Nesterenkonia sp. HG001 TaxID=2983207 RepID=UPI002AC77C72|nr:septation protein SepH [Nesterenkonia sp. HG001]MDZ5078373.1 septation protein SepH [Nesterenkonia sp. HG001]